jgi:hypothetical protein
MQKDIEKGEVFPGDEEDNSNPTSSFLSPNERATANERDFIGDARTFIRSTYEQGCPCKHPIAGFFHLFFKVCALLTYLLSSIFRVSFVTTFVLCVLLLAFDFWTVKNITGRLLVGLRWWNEVQEDGTNVWKFESRENLDDVAPVDSYLFWITLYAQPLIWVLMIIAAILTVNPSWIFVNVFAILLSGSNAYGYFKCQKDAKNRLANFVIERGWLQSIAGRLLSFRT